MLRSRYKSVNFGARGHHTGRPKHTQTDPGLFTGACAPIARRLLSIHVYAIVYSIVRSMQYVSGPRRRSYCRPSLRVGRPLPGLQTQHPNPKTSRETGILLPNNQRQHRTSHAPTDVLSLRVCVNYCAPCQPLVRAFSGWIRYQPPTTTWNKPPAAKRRRRTMHARALPSEEERPEKVLRTLTPKPRPESGLDCLMCAIFARQRSNPATQ